MKRIFAALLVLLLADAPAWASVAFDAVSSSGCTGCISDSWFHTTSGTNTYMLCGGGFNDLFGGTTADFTYDSDPFTEKDTISISTVEAILHQRTAPATGTNTVEVTYSNVVNSAIGCMTFTGVDQSTPGGTSADSADTAGSLEAAITVPADGMGVSFAMYSESVGSCPDQTAGEDERFEICDPEFAVGGMGSTTTSAGAVTMDWTFSGFGYSAMIAMPINAATGVTRQRIMISE